MLVQTDLTIKEREHLDEQMVAVYTEIGYVHHGVAEAERLLKYCWKYVFPFFYDNWKEPDLENAISKAKNRNASKIKKGDSLIPEVPTSVYDIIDEMTLGALIYNWLKQTATIDQDQERWLRQFHELRNHFNHSSFYEQYNLNTENGVIEALTHLTVFKEHTRDLINILKRVRLHHLLVKRFLCWCTTFRLVKYHSESSLVL
jgi:hypothetical protein